MRTLDAALTSAQQSASRTPYRRVYFDNRAGTTYTYTTKDATNRILYLSQWEEAYAGVAVLRMNNYDGHFTAMDLRGYSVTLGWGFELDTTPDTTWYSNAAPMKVLMQRDISVEGKLFTEFYCISIWAEIAQKYIFQGGKKITGTIAGTFTIGELVTGSPSAATGRLAAVSGGYIVVTRVTGTFTTGDTCTGGTSGATVGSLTAVADNYGILVYNAGDTTTEARIEALTGLTVDVDSDDSYSSMADTPYLAVEVGSSIRDTIRRMLLRTKDGIRYGADGKLHALYLDPAAVAQYSFDGSHVFLSDLREQAIIIPNTVYVVSEKVGVSNAPAYIGTANDATSVAKIGTLVAPIQVDPDAASQADVDNRASAWIAQKVADAYQGKIVSSMECGLEVYDMVSAVDGRLAVTSKGRIGRLEREYDSEKGIDEFRATLGSLFTEPGAMELGPGSLDSDLSDLVEGLEPSPPVLEPDILPWQLPEAIQGYVHDIVFSATDNDTIAWTAGTITFYDGSTQAILAGNTGNMADTNLRYVYFDLDDASPSVLKVQKVEDYISTYLSTRTGVVCLVRKSSAADINAAFLPSHGKEPLITADWIHLAGLTMDRLADGSTYRRLLATDIAAGHIKLTSNVVVDGEWYDVSGVEIDATHGINIYGTLNALTTRATKTGTVQCYVGSNGKLYAGAGTVYMDANGLTISTPDGTSYLIFYWSGASPATVGYVRARAADELAVTAAALKNLILEADGQLIKAIATAINPYTDGAVNLGDATHFWGILRVNQIEMGSNDINMNSRWITELSDPLLAQDAATKAYVDAAGGSAAFSTMSNVTATRSLGTVYQNTSGKTMLVHVSESMTQAGTPSFYCGASDPPGEIGTLSDAEGGDYSSATFAVPDNYYYKVQAIGAGTVYRWIEWT